MEKKVSVSVSEKKSRSRAKFWPCHTVCRKDQFAENYIIHLSNLFLQGFGTDHSNAIANGGDAVANDYGNGENAVAIADGNGGDAVANVKANSGEVVRLNVTGNVGNGSDYGPAIPVPFKPKPGKPF